ncbi:MAG: nitroreductase family protein [Flavipsychrobacter sp.]|nr:nitroreductase family protein [Flavipsychrobacter sp.]
MNLLEALNWRYATKRMTGKKVSRETVDRILDAAQLAPSSAGLQPYNIILVENEELRKKIQAVAFNQPQIVEASHLLIFAAWNDVTEKEVSEYINRMAAERNIPVESLSYLNGSLMNLVNNKTQEEKYQWTARQAYIAFGIAIAAATEGVDATPMEGFNPAALDELLGLKEKGLRSVTILTLGYRDTENDLLHTAKKIRRPKEHMVLEMS